MLYNNGVKWLFSTDYCSYYYYYMFVQQLHKNRYGTVKYAIICNKALIDMHTTVHNKIKLL